MEKLQKKGVLISTNYVKKNEKEFYIISCLLDNSTTIVKIFTTKEVYDNYKDKPRFSPLLINISLNIDNNRIYYSL